MNPPRFRATVPEVLVAIGDAFGLREDLIEILQLEGARVTEFGVGVGLEAQVESCDVFVVDIDLRKRGGVDLVLAARRLRPELDVLVTSAVRPSDLQREAGELALVPEPIRMELLPLLEDDKVVWLTKPFEVERLTEFVFGVPRAEAAGS